MMKTRIGILKPGAAPENLAAVQGDYDFLFRQLLGEDDFDYVAYDVEKGIFPPNAMVTDGWIITGSRHGVYEDHAWIAPLERLIRDIQAAGRPLVGICFGHQIVAQALGGRVERAASGWIAGPQTYTDTTGREFHVNAWHRDQVVEAPPGAEVFASGAECPIAGLRYTGPILTLQPHPEFSMPYLAGLFEERGAALPEAVQAATLTSMQYGFVDQVSMGQVLREILKSGARGR
ncbi:type 1 glutamine amidotransferase [Neorhizobium sp. NCHU2750]|uniref:type 1 glutamine amidotransferase n=1 Tax=Neorhizobium sp. NCHU2750 TaxID=1825976 RepID=UPI000E709D9D|nr:glutamine amidotransferase [Neorhizobium sp. NCHU2750]